jgi:hypothetical protein
LSLPIFRFEDRVWKYCCENGNVEIENSKTLKYCKEKYRHLEKNEVARARCPSIFPEGYLMHVFIPIIPT